MDKSNHATAAKSIQDIAKQYGKWLKAPVIATNPEKVTCVKGWPSLTPDKSLKAGNLVLFHKQYQNIAIVLGKAAGGLSCIDCDAPGLFDEIIELNPRFADTLMSQASRGPVIWLRLPGDFPKLTPLTRGGKHVGEWRADGGYQIIHGRHHEGVDYHHNGKEPIYEHRRKIQSVADRKNAIIQRRLEIERDEKKKWCKALDSLDLQDFNAWRKVRDDLESFKSAVTYLYQGSHGHEESLTGHDAGVEGEILDAVVLLHNRTSALLEEYRAVEREQQSKLGLVPGDSPSLDPIKKYLAELNEAIEQIPNWGGGMVQSVWKRFNHLIR